MATDQERLEQLFLAEHPCIAILTCEEEAAMDVVRSAAVEAGREMLQWSVTQGVRDGLLAESAAVTDSEHPAAALFYLASLNRPLVAVMFDLIGHLKDERT